MDIKPLEHDHKQKRSSEPIDTGDTPASDSRPPKTPRSWHGVLSTIGLFISALVIALLLNSFVIQSYQVDGESMQPTLMNNDRLVVDKVPRTIARIDGHQYVPKRGDIIIFNEDGLPGFIGTKQLIKRVIGLPGDHIVINGATTTVYNRSHPQGYDPDTSGDYHAALGRSACGNGDFTLTSDQLFVMGDNRANSEDSRCFGPITTDQVVAKLIFRILPLSKAKAF